MNRKFLAIVVVLLMTLVIPMKAFAVENITMPTEDMEQDIISVDFPTLQEDEESPFDFIIDPQHLLFETSAVAYGGGIVEEGANLLFHNHAEGEYIFSRYSDNLAVKNHSTVPVMITISAQITDTEDIQIVQDKNFPKDGLCCIYLALVDDEGNEQPLSKDGEVLICVEIQDFYSFGLTGECNSDADWSSVSVHPKVTVNWKAEPILTEREDVLERDDLLFEELRTEGIDEDILDEDAGRNANEVDDEDIANKKMLNPDEIVSDGSNEDIADENVENIDHKDLEIKKNIVDK